MKNKTFIIVGDFGSSKEIMVGIVHSFRKATPIIIEYINQTEQELKNKIEENNKRKDDTYIKTVKLENIPKSIRDNAIIYYSDGILEIIKDFIDIDELLEYLGKDDTK